MDKRVLTWVGLGIVGFLILTKTQLVNMLFAFFVLGLIPGTDVLIPFWLMIVVYPILFVAGIIWLREQAFWIGEAVNTQPVVAKAAPKPRKKSVKSTRKVAPKRQPRTAV